MAAIAESMGGGSARRSQPDSARGDSSSWPGTAARLSGSRVPACGPGRDVAVATVSRSGDLPA
jgi:hypothetical protein